MIRTYVSFHILGFSKIVKRFVLLFNGRWFAMAFNVYAQILDKDVRFSFDPKTGFYHALGNSSMMYFRNKVQAFNAYHLGMTARAKDIGGIYHLGYIKFDDQDIVVDCGANVGDLMLYFQCLGKSIKYVGFEPSPEEFLCLSRNVKTELLYNKGLWNTSSNLMFYLSSDGADSSLIEPNEYSKEIPVPTVRLDEILSDIDRIKLLKLEAEGAEPEVIEGASSLLSRIEYISADLGFERGVKQESTLADVTNTLLKNGFELLSVSHTRIVALFINTNFISSSPVDHERN